MSVFSRKTVVAVSATTVTLNEEFPVDRLTTILLAGTREDTNNISERAVYSALTGYRGDLNRFYNYGIDSYTYGAPETNIANTEVNALAVKAVLDADITIITPPDFAVIIDSFLRKPTAFAWAQVWLYDNDGTYLQADQTVVQDTITYDVVDASFNFARTELTINLDDGGTPAVYATTVTSIPDEELYYVVEYFKDLTPTVNHIWAYKASLGTHPTLDVDATFVFDPILPIVPIRSGDVNINNDKDSVLYLTTKALLNNVKVDLDELTEAVTTELNEDGDRVPLTDLRLISDIFYLYGTNIYGESQVEKKALYVLFGDLEAQSRTTETSYNTEVGSTNAVSNNHFFIETDNYKFFLEFNYINTNTIAGSVAEKGEYATAWVPINGLFHGRGPDIPAEIIVRNTLKIRYQHKVNEYLELEVQGLLIKHEIDSIKGPIAATFNITAYTEGNDLSVEQQNFIIPLSINTINGLTLREADQLISIINKIQVYASDSKKLKWYQSTFFSAIIKFVGIVLAFISLLGDPSGLTASEILVSVASVIAIKYVFEYVLFHLLAHFGDNNFLTAIIQIVAVIVIVLFIGSEGFLDMPLVEQTILAVSAVSSVAVTSAAVSMDLLEQERLSFEADLEAAEKAVEEANEFLNVGNLMDPTALIDITNSQYEQPGAFYNRTLMTNPGILAYDHLHNYVDINLNLEYIRV